jgi:hypothetical protein
MRSRVRAVARVAVVRARRVLLRLLRPLVRGLDAQLQLLFELHQDDRTRIINLEQQNRLLARQVEALQRQLDARSRAA